MKYKTITISLRKLGLKKNNKIHIEPLSDVHIPENFKARPFPKKGTIPCKGCGYLLPEDSIAVQEWDGYCDDCMSNVPHNERDMMMGDDY